MGIEHRKELAKLGFDEDQLKSTHDQLMFKDVWSMKKYQFSVHTDNAERLDAAFEVVADITHLSKVDLINKANALKNESLEFLDQTTKLTGRDANKVAVKIIETRHSIQSL